MNNGLVRANTAVNGGGAWGGILNNCTLAHNEAACSGGGTFTGYGYGVQLKNCIVYYNTAKTNADAADAALSYCCTPVAGGTGNITNAPQFVNGAAGDYRLRASSPCINQGANVFAAGTTALDGNPRIVNGVVDMGAYEYGSSLWAGAEDAGGGWKYLAWFGSFQDAGGGRIWHTEHGWLHSNGTSPSSIWFWSSRRGWMWTSCSVYPFFWNTKAEAWLWYYRGTGDGTGGWFYNHRTKRTEWR